MITRNANIVERASLLALVLVATLFVANAAFAADVTVHVSKRGSSGPLNNVAVCLGTRGVPSQFGAVLTDRSGMAKFRNVPTTELVLIASRPGMRGKRTSLLASTWNRSLVVSLPAGGGGPECTAKAAKVALAVERTGTSDALGGLGIHNFRINNGERATTVPSVTLDFTYSGDATHYRVSERSDFRSAEWLPIDAERRFDLSASTGQKDRLYAGAKVHHRPRR